MVERTFANKIDVLNKIGSGGFASVYRIRDLQDNQIYALKWISVGESKKARKIALREVQMMERLRYGGIVQCYDAWEEWHPKEWRKISNKCIKEICDKREELEEIVQNNSKITDFDPEAKGSCTYVYFLMEPCTVTLKDWMKENDTEEKRPLPVMKNWIKQLVEAVSYLNGYDIYYNFQSADDIYIILENAQPVLKIGTRGLAYNTKKNFSSYPDPLVDIRTLACIVTELLVIFPNDRVKNKALIKLKNQRIPICLRDYSDEIRDFLLCCFSALSVEPILSHNFLADIEDRIPENFIQSLANSAQPIEETYSFLDYVRTIDEDLLETSRINIESFKQFNSTLYKEYVIEEKVMSDDKGDLFSVRSNIDTHPYMLRRFVLPHETNHARLDILITRTKLLNHRGLVKIHEMWAESPPKGWKVLYDMINLRKVNMTKFKNELTSLLPRNRLNIQQSQTQDIPKLLRSEIFIIMKLCDGDLQEWLVKNNSAEKHPLCQMKKWIKQLAEALSHIHQLNLIHRDLKPANIFLLQCNDQSMYPPLVIGDFGLAREVGNQNFGTGRNNSRRRIDLTENVGTDSYMSPEQSDGQIYNQKVDIFALGLIATELIIPFGTVSEKSEVFTKLKSDTIPEQFTNYPEANEFLLFLTKINPADRPTAEEILAHQLFTDLQ